jgi:hypothetical protein
MNSEWSALIIKAPALNSKNVDTSCHPIVLPGGAATAVIDIFAAPVAVAAELQEGRYFRVRCTVDVRIAFSNDIGMADPDPVNDWPIPAGETGEFWVNPNFSRYFKVYSAVAGAGNWYLG